jgi:hypothetical protein
VVFKGNKGAGKGRNRGPINRVAHLCCGFCTGQGNDQFLLATAHAAVAYTATAYAANAYTATAHKIESCLRQKQKAPKTK